MVEALKGDLAEAYGGGIVGRSSRGIWWRHWREV